MPINPGPSGRPALVRSWLAPIAIAFEAFGLLVLGGYLAVETVVSRPAQPAASAGLAAMTVLCGVGLFLVARGLLLERRWARGPAITWQLLQGAVSLSTFSGRLPLLIPLVGAAVVVLAALVSSAAAEG